MNNLELLVLSLKHNEPYIEDAYAKESVLITSAGVPETAVMRANRELSDQITAYKVALHNRNAAMCETIIETMLDLLDTATSRRVICYISHTGTARMSFKSARTVLHTSAAASSDCVNSRPCLTMQVYEDSAIDRMCRIFLTPMGCICAPTATAKSCSCRYWRN